MRKNIHYIRQNLIELIITFCILSNLFGFFLPKYLYYLGLGILAFKMSKMGVKHNKNSKMFILFILLIVISSLINMMLDLRLVLFSFILILACPIYTSLRWHLYKKRIMQNLFIGFIGVVLINLYAKMIGYNLRAMIQGWEDLTDKQFSGFCDQPMWLAVLVHTVSARGYRNFGKCGMMWEFNTAEEFLKNLQLLIQDIKQKKITREMIMNEACRMFAFGQAVEKMKKTINK